MVPFVKASAPVFLLALVSTGFAQEQPPQAGPKPAGTNYAVYLPEVPLDEFAALLKEAVVKQLPANIVVENNHNWGRQTRALSVHGVKAVHVMRNNGDWEKAKTAAYDLPHQLKLRAYGLSSPVEDRIVFMVHLDAPAMVELEEKVWHHGMQVFASHGRARLRIQADVTLETGIIEAPKEGSPLNRVARLQLTGATVRCENFVAQNIDGIGGEVAKRAGGLLRQSFKPWRPAIESEFNNKFCAAILSAGGTPAVSSGLSKLLADSRTARTTVIQAQAAAATTPALPTQLGPRCRPQCQEDFPLFSLDLELYFAHAAHAQADHPSHAEHHYDSTHHFDPPTHSEHASHPGTLNSHHEVPKKK